MSPLLLTVVAVLALAASTAHGASGSPFSPRAALLRHWRRTFPSAGEMPGVLVSKASPLNATQLAAFSSYLESRTLPRHLAAFCSAANLFCEMKQGGNSTHDVDTDANFESYGSKSFKRYQTDAVSATDSFTNYSVDANVASNGFVRYGQDSDGSESFRNYELQTNVATSNFDNYGTRSGVLATFTSYSNGANVQKQDFKTYGRESNGLLQQFSSYSENSNVVTNGFDNYAKDANGALSQFSGYSTSSNVITNKFNNYDDNGNGGLHQFNNYADSINVGSNEFKAYSKDSNGPLDQFTSYGNGGSQPRSNFQSYGKGANALTATFTNYANSSFLTNATTQFVEYNREGSGDATFTTYASGTNSSAFKQYFSGTTFNEYQNSSSARASVEPGKFFRQSTLVAGNRIPFPDIRDKMPKRSFLPRSLANKFPFSTEKLPELVQTLGAPDMRGMMARTISECERPATKDETKRCVTSLEAMSEFAESMLGSSGRVSATESTAGWGEKLVVGKVVPRNGGEETRSVSCHQSQFPYLVYYCHMVPRVKVYDVELRRTAEGGKLNQAVAICHLDTTQWSANHAAFVALGPAPGKIEVCHFIFENDLIWVASR